MSKKLKWLHFDAKGDPNVDLTAVLLNLHLNMEIEKATILLKRVASGEQGDHFTTAVVEEEFLPTLIEDAEALGFVIIPSNCEL